MSSGASGWREERTFLADDGAVSVLEGEHPLVEPREHRTLLHLPSSLDQHAMLTLDQHAVIRFTQPLRCVSAHGSSQDDFLASEVLHRAVRP